VSDAERFAPLVTVANDLVSGLRRRFDVEVVEEPVEGPRELSAVRVHPVRGEGADLVVVRTDFPGVYLRAGRWLDESYPHCGCDACDESVDDLVEEMEGLVADVVAGRFGEELTGGPGRHALHHWRTNRHATAYLEPEEASSYGEPGRYEWAPWPERLATTGG
jgi:hypothetical protein